MPWQQQSKHSNIEGQWPFPERHKSRRVQVFPCKLSWGACQKLHFTIRSCCVAFIYPAELSCLTDRVKQDARLIWIVHYQYLVLPGLPFSDRSLRERYKEAQLSGTSRAGPKRSTLKEPMAVTVCGLSPLPFVKIVVVSMSSEESKVRIYIYIYTYV